MLENILRYLCWIIIVFMQTSKCRKYDVEQEAHNLYNIDLKSVVERFRHTPEYLKILSNEINLRRKSVGEIITNIVTNYKNELTKKIAGFFESNETMALRIVRRLQIDKKIRISQKRFRKAKKPHNEILDNMMLLSFLPLEQKNRMKDFGFEYAGRAIHAMIKYISTDDALPVSTLLPYGGDSPGTSTIKNHHNHEVTHDTLPDTEANETTPHHIHTTGDLS